MKFEPDMDNLCLKYTGHQPLDLELLTAKPWHKLTPGQRRLFTLGWRDGFVCRGCGAEKLLTIDHIIPLSLGGSDAEDNLQILCVSCNGRKGNRLFEPLEVRPCPN